MTYRNKIKDIKLSEDFEPSDLACEEVEVRELPF
jgi:hypothetical protein